MSGEKGEPMPDHESYNARLAKLEAVVSTPKIGLVDQFGHIHACVESLKRTVWLATGATSAVAFFLQWFLK